MQAAQAVDDSMGQMMTRVTSHRVHPPPPVSLALCITWWSVAALAGGPGGEATDVAGGTERSGHMLLCTATVTSTLLGTGRPPTGPCPQGMSSCSVAAAVRAGSSSPGCRRASPGVSGAFASAADRRAAAAARTRRARGTTPTVAPGRQRLARRRQCPRVTRCRRRNRRRRQRRGHRGRWSLEVAEFGRA